MNTKNYFIPVIAGTIFMVVLILGVMSISVVSVGHTGILLTFGRVQDTPLSEGLHFKIPFAQQIVEMDNRIQKIDATIENVAKSQDMQTVNSSITVNYQLEQRQTHRVYRTIGRDFEIKVVRPAVEKTVVDIISQYTAEELINNRSVVSDKMFEDLSTKMDEYGIVIRSITNIVFDFTADFVEEIEKKQLATQRQQAVMIENDTMILRAAAEAERIEIEAKGIAEARKAEAAGIAEAFRLQNQYLTELNVQLEWISKWDGRVPVVQSGDGGMILDVGNLID
jgi:regulator of protease activity HflC (stomatin/prohibitin superfamily)